MTINCLPQQQKNPQRVRPGPGEDVDPGAVQRDQGGGEGARFDPAAQDHLPGGHRRGGGAGLRRGHIRVIGQSDGGRVRCCTW